MDFALLFFEVFLVAVMVASPILITLALIIVLLGLMVGRKEGWRRFDALYWSFITATTVGYGDLRPTRPLSKALSVTIAILGLILTGIIVAIGVYSASVALDQRVGTETFQNGIEKTVHEP